MREKVQIGALKMGQNAVKIVACKKRSLRFHVTFFCFIFFFQTSLMCGPDWVKSKRFFGLSLFSAEVHLFHPCLLLFLEEEHQRDRKLIMGGQLTESREVCIRR